MKRYEEYNQIESRWLQELPIQWQWTSLNAIMWFRNEKNNPVKTKDILSLSAAHGVTPYSEKKTGGNKAKEDLSKYNIGHENDLLVNSMNVVAGSSGLSNYYGAISPVYYAFHVRDKKDNVKYYEYLFRNKFFYESLVGLGNGIMMKMSSMGKLNTVRMRIPVIKMKKILLPRPSESEQNQIVRYLDWKTSEMNHFINQKKKQIKNLEELKWAKIDHAITKGLSNAQMKDSGLDWIGKIPGHWGVDTIKQHFTVKKRIAGEEGYDVLSITQQGIKVKDISTNEGQMAQSYANYQFVYPGEFAMNHMDLITGFVDLSKYSGVTSPDYRVFVLDDTEHCDANFYLRVFQIGYKRRIFYKFGKGAASQGRWRLPKDAFYGYSIQIPPIDEQKEIVGECNRIEDSINKMIEGVEKEIKLIEELKTKLIADVVTGQIDVRDVVIPEYITEEEISDETADDDSEEAVSDSEE
jgi:type I restriction enzyme S subunit